MPAWVTVLIALVSLSGNGVANAEIRVAVASNFARTAESLAKEFEGLGNPKLSLLFGSTGKHTAQIENGLPVDLLLAADSVRPAYLEKKKLSVENTRATYAIGRLAVWFPEGSIQSLTAFERVLDDVGFVAVANPALAPYGSAAMQLIDRLKNNQSISEKIVMGENIAQTFQYVKTRNVEIGLLAYSQVLTLPKEQWWLVPHWFHEPITQQMVILRDSPGVRAFYEFVLSPKGMAITQKHGYDTP